MMKTTIRNQDIGRHLTTLECSKLAPQLEKLLKEKARKTSSDNNRHIQETKKESDNDCELDRSRRNNGLNSTKTDKEKYKKWRENSVDGQLAAIAGVSDHQIIRTRKPERKGWSKSWTCG